MPKKYHKATTLLKQCLKHRDDAVKALAKGQDPDESLSAMSDLARSVPADASDAHAFLLSACTRGLQTDGSVLQGRNQSSPLNPQHVVEGHWNSLASVPELWGGLVHGGVLTLEGNSGPEHYLLTGGRVHLDLLWRAGAPWPFNNLTGIGLTIQKWDGSAYTIPILAQKTNNKALNDNFFGPGAWSAFEDQLLKCGKSNMTGVFSNEAGFAAYMRYFLRTPEIDRHAEWFLSPSTLDFAHPDKRWRDFTWKPGDAWLPMRADANDPFNAHYAPQFEGDKPLHRSAYIDVISFDPAIRPAIITYVSGVQDKLSFTPDRTVSSNVQTQAEYWSTEIFIIE